MKIKMTITTEDNERLNYEEFKIELDYLAKEWNIFFSKYLSGWDIIGYPKDKKLNKKKAEVKKI